MRRVDNRCCVDMAALEAMIVKGDESAEVEVEDGVSDGSLHVSRASAQYRYNSCDAKNATG